MNKPKIPSHVIEDIKGSIIHGVGYRSPPTQHQFKKGQSGNPKGRPPKALANTQKSTIVADSHAAIMVKVLNEAVTIHHLGKRKSISKAEAVQRNSEKLAMKGSVLANRDLRQQLLAEDARRQKEVKDDHELHHLYLQARASALKHATSRGDALTEFWIDPEDMIFRPNQMVRIKGAASVESQPYFEFLESFLKLMIFEVTFDCIHFASENDPVRAEIEFIAYLQQTVSSAEARASEAYWTDIEERLVCCNWRAATVERQRLWAAVNLPMPKTRWLKPMSAKNLKFVEQNRDPIRAMLMAIRFSKAGKWKIKSSN